MSSSAIAAPALILHHAKVITVDSKFHIAEAVAVNADGTIAAVGGNDEVLALKAGDTQMIDLAGRTLMPGLMDSHVHPGAAMTEFDHEIPTMETIADVLAYISSRVKASKPGDLILVRQVFITRLEEKRYPTRAELDRVAPENPVVFSTGPDSMLNSLALKLSGYDRNFKVPEGGASRMEIDPASGVTDILRYTAVIDVGVELNPELVRGQAIGGIVQAIGQAMMEEVVYDADGQVLTGSFMDYAMPRALDMCNIEIGSHPVPTKTNPLGVKGAGETTTVGALAAVMNALNDALAPCGIDNFQMPATPARVWRAIWDARAAT